MLVSCGHTPVGFDERVLEKRKGGSVEVIGEDDNYNNNLCDSSEL